LPFSREASTDIEAGQEAVAEIFAGDVAEYEFHELGVWQEVDLQIQSAIDLLYQKSARQFRKINPIPARIHCLSVGEDFAIVAQALFSPGDIQQGVIEALLHDNIEDFKTTYAELCREFIFSIADDVWLMTTPPDAVLAGIYKDTIVRDYFNPDNLPSQLPSSYEAAIERIKADSRLNRDDTYEKLRSRLKLAFKMDAVKKFSFLVAVIKAIDNLKSLQDYANDIDERRVLLQPDGKLGPARSMNGGAPYILSCAELRRNIRDRETYHNQIITHIQFLATQPEAGRHQPGTHEAACEILNAYFDATKNRLLQHMRRVPAVPQHYLLKAA